MAAFGIDAGVQAEILGEDADADEPFGVYNDNADVVRLFLACSTQWRMAPSGAPIGLDYAACDCAIRRLDLDCDSDLFAGLQVMERAAVQEMMRRLDR